MGIVVFVCFVTLLATVFVFVSSQSRGDLLAIWFQPDWLVALTILPAAVAIAWCGVIISAHLVCRPSSLSVAQRIGAWSLVLALCAVVGVPLGRGAYLAYAQYDFVTSVFSADPGATEGDDEPSPLAGVDRINVLLLGSDAAPNRDGVRTDSITLASIDTQTGDTVLLSLPRNLYRIPFPPGSPMDEQFPSGFRGEPVGNHLLNAVYRYGTEHPDLAPAGAHDPGASLVMSAVETIFDLDVDYYIMVNLRGFQRIIDAMDGITIRVEERIPIGGGTSPIVGYIEPGLQRLDGLEALWYARSREGTSDYDRMARQRCVFGAVAREADPWTVLMNYRTITAAAKNTIQTNIPLALLPELAKVAGNAKAAEITNVQFVPPLVETFDPDYDLIRRTAHAAIAAAENSTSTATTMPPSTEETPNDESTNAPFGESVPLDEACKYK